MCLPRRSFVVFAFVALTVPAFAQQSATNVQRDSQALAVVTKTLNAAGGVALLTDIKDFTASGTVAYNWGDSPVEGNVTVKGRGIAEFRIDATLPEGMHSWAMNSGTALEKHSDGTITPLPYPVTLRPANSTFPFFRLLAALQDTSWNISPVATVEHEGKPAYDITLQKIYTDGGDPTGFKSEVTKTDFIIDPNTSLILSILDKAYPRDSSPGNTPHEMQFSNYQSFGGVLLPCTITELIGGQQTETIQLTQVAFNSGLSDSDFALQ